MASEDSYFTLKDRSESLYKVKGSKHFGYAAPARNEEEAKVFLEQIRKEHHSARHHCFAWRLGLDKKRFRASDDGEPSNSAGKPILGQIQAFDLSDVVIVVVRYFGGTKLGVGGLIDAYKTAAKLAIEAGTIEETVVKTAFEVTFPPSLTGDVMHQLNGMELPIFEQGFESGNCTILSEIRTGDWKQLEERLGSIYQVELKKR